MQPKVTKKKKSSRMQAILCFLHLLYFLIFHSPLIDSNINRDRCPCYGFQAFPITMSLNSVCVYIYIYIYIYVC